MYRVLLVEDDPDVQLLIEDFLDMYPWQFQISKTTRGSDAIRMALDMQPDLVLLDVRLGDHIDGYEVARQLRSHPSTADTRIVMLSGMDDPVDQHIGKRSGANEYVAKPVQSRILLAVLQDLLGDAQS